jgi:hypothetical protein
MARKIRLRSEEWKVFLEDVEEEMDNPKYDPERDEGEDNEKKTMVMICKAFLVDDDTPSDATTFTLRSVLLPTSLKVGQYARNKKYDDAVMMVLKKSLKGWSNILDSKGKDLPFSYKNIDILPLEEATAVSNYVMEQVAGPNKSEEDRDLGND